MASQLFASEKTGAEGGSGIAGNGLDADVFEAAAQFERANEKDIQKDAAREAEGVRCCGLLEILCERDDELFEEVLRAAGNVCAKRGIDWRAGLGQSGVSIEAR